MSVNEVVSQEGGSIQIKISCTKLNNDWKKLSRCVKRSKPKEVKLIFRRTQLIYNYTTNVLMTVSASPMNFEVVAVETHSFELHFQLIKQFMLPWCLKVPLIFQDWQSYDNDNTMSISKAIFKQLLKIHWTHNLYSRNLKSYSLENMEWVKICLIHDQFKIWKYSTNNYTNNTQLYLFRPLLVHYQLS